VARKRPTASNVEPSPLTCIPGGKGDAPPVTSVATRRARRLVEDTERLSSAVWSLFDTLQDRVTSIETRNQALVGELVTQRAALARAQSHIDELTFLQETNQERIDELIGGDRTLQHGALVAPAPCPLSSREVEVLACLAEGKVYKQIALELSVSASTVRSHLHNVYSKLGAVDRAQAVLLASRRGWL
jgi:DNA-binding NarL/FixJ family response regulator